MVRAPASAAVALAVLVACGGTPTETQPATEAPDGGTAPPREAAAGIVAGLTVDAGAEAPVFSWQPVPDAAEYYVTVSEAGAEEAPWAWIGPETSVAYGSVSPEDTLAVDIGVETFISARRGATYEWLVIALDEEGDIIASSEIATFDCADPCGAVATPEPTPAPS